MYQVLAIVELMTWLNKNRLTDGKVHPAPDNNNGLTLMPHGLSLLLILAIYDWALLQMDLMHLRKRVQVG
jgi:hypothetical protein